VINVDPNIVKLLTVVLSAVVGAISMLVVFFVKSYFTSNKEKITEGESDRKKFVSAINKIEIQLTKMEGERHTEHAKMYGKMKELKAEISGYVRETSKLVGKVEQNTEALHKSTTLLDHISRQSKRLFSIVLPMQRDVEEFKAGMGPS